MTPREALVQFHAEAVLARIDSSVDTRRFEDAQLEDLTAETELIISDAVQAEISSAVSKHGEWARSVLGELTTAALELRMERGNALEFFVDAVDARLEEEAKPEGKVVVLKAASGEKVKVRLRDDLPEGVGESVNVPGNYIVLARPGVGWPKLDMAANFAEKIRKGTSAFSKPDEDYR